MSWVARQRVNYDTIAHLYDEPLRDHDPDPGLARFIEERALQPAQLHLLDMGCGTGKQVAANRSAYPDATIIGSDLFAGMLTQAQRRNAHVTLVQGSSAALPFRAHSFDYISNQFSYQHVLDQPRMIADTLRLLKSRGRFVMVNIDPWSMPDWLIYTYFPAAQERDLRDFLAIDTFIALMRQVGFVNITVNRVHQHDTQLLTQFLAYVSDRWRTSQLLCIPDSAYDQGLAKLKADLAQRGEAATVDTEFCLVTVSGDKP